MKMKAEIRLGNYVLCNGLRTCIDEHLFIDILKGNVQYTIEPLRLTPEILEKSGFEKYGRWYSKDNINVSLDGTLAVQDWITKSTPIIYLYQLQNLYHSLTGQELTINI